jgi:hypothetical protein
MLKIVSLALLAATECPFALVTLAVPQQASFRSRL